MTHFQKELFYFDGMYLTYNGTFVARFKHARGERTTFQKFLVANFSTEEYFEKLNSGIPPLKVLETKGYVSNNVKKLLKQMGYEQTIEGFRKYLSVSSSKKITA